MGKIDTVINLKEVVLSVLFVAGDGIEKDFIAEKLEVTEKEISVVFSLEEEKAIKRFKEEEYKALVEECFVAKRKGVPFTNAEKLRDGYETEYFSRIKYELKNSQPFLYYVYRRRIENANVRILFVCLLAGLTETEIKKRLRSV